MKLEKERTLPIVKAALNIFSGRIAGNGNGRSAEGGSGKGASR